MNALQRQRPFRSRPVRSRPCSRRRCRRGAVTLLLALVMLLVVMASVAATTGNELSMLQNQNSRASTKRLESAIEAVAMSDMDLTSPIRLPIDPASEHWIEVQRLEPAAASGPSLASPSSDTMTFKATERRGDRILSSIERRLHQAEK